jgi:hypothetical protein
MRKVRHATPPVWGVPLPGTDAAARRGSRHTVQQLRARWACGTTDSFDSSEGKIYAAPPVSNELATGWVRVGPSFDKWAAITGVDSVVFRRAWQRPSRPAGLYMLNNGDGGST